MLWAIYVTAWVEPEHKVQIDLFNQSQLAGIRISREILIDIGLCDWRTELRPNFRDACSLPFRVCRTFIDTWLPYLLTQYYTAIISRVKLWRGSQKIPSFSWIDILGRQKLRRQFLATKSYADVATHLQWYQYDTGCPWTRMSSLKKVHWSARFSQNSLDEKHVYILIHPLHGILLNAMYNSAIDVRKAKTSRPLSQPEGGPETNKNGKHNFWRRNLSNEIDSKYLRPPRLTPHTFSALLAFAIGTPNIYSFRGWIEHVRYAWTL